MQGPIEEAEKTFLEPLPSTAEWIVWTGCVDKPIIQCNGALVPKFDEYQRPIASHSEIFYRRISIQPSKSAQKKLNKTTTAF